jgi:hypothetical protein
MVANAEGRRTRIHNLLSRSLPAIWISVEELVYARSDWSPGRRLGLNAAAASNALSAASNALSKDDQSGFRCDHRI